MPELLTLQDLANGHLDIKALGEAANGDDSTDVETRLGGVYPTLAKAIKTILEQGTLDATLFKTKALMIASALPDDSYALVTDDTTTSNNGYYQKQSGTWVFSGYNPVAQSKVYTDEAILRKISTNERGNVFEFEDGRGVLGVAFDESASVIANNIYTDEDDNLAFKIVDENNITAFAIDKDGYLVTPTLSTIKVADSDFKFNSDFIKSDYMHVFEFEDGRGVLGVAFDESASVIANNIYTDEDDNLAFKIVDENNITAFAIDKDGYLVTPTLSTIKVADSDFKFNSDFIKSDYMHVFSYGQSLSRGARARPPISTTQPYNNVTFNSGVLVKALDGSQDFTGFKPLVEEQNSSEGETPLSGMLNTFVSKQTSPNDWVFIGSAPGKGGVIIEELSKGTDLYNELLVQTQAAYDVAQSQGSSYRVWCIAWTQGESNHTRGSNSMAYKTLLTQLQVDLSADIQAITGQSEPIPFVMYQTAAHKHYAKEKLTIAMPQYEIASENDNFVMATPIYHLPHYTDGLHLTADSSYQLGKYYANSLEYWYRTGKKWQPLKPVDILVQGLLIDVSFTKTDLQIDTTLVAQTHNYGFDLWDGDTLLDIISDVVVAGNRVKLILSSPAPASATISYGKGRAGDPETSGNIDGARGNIRDSAGYKDNYTDSEGMTRYMHNWCVMFELTIN